MTAKGITLALCFMCTAVIASAQDAAKPKPKAPPPPPAKAEVTKFDPPKVVKDEPASKTAKALPPKVEMKKFTPPTLVKDEPAPKSAKAPVKPKTAHSKTGVKKSGKVPPPPPPVPAKN